MQDAYVLAEALWAEASLESAVGAYVSRRTPRVAWIRQQSRAVAERFRLPPAASTAALRARGDQMMRERFRPLVSAP
jgi:FAD-dependent urate hydroxylase